MFDMLFVATKGAVLTSGWWVVGAGLAGVLLGVLFNNLRDGKASALPGVFGFLGALAALAVAGLEWWRH